MYMTVYDTLEEIFENISWKKRSWNNLYLREGEKSLCIWYVWNLKTCENGEVMSPFTLYGKLKWVGVIPPKSFRKEPIRWIYTSSLDVWNSTPLGAFNSALRASKCQWQSWSAWIIHPMLVNWGIIRSCVIEFKTLFFLLLRKGKIKVLRGYCRGGGPKFVCIGPWAYESPNW